MYSGYRIAFDRKGECSFGIDYARNVAIFRVDNSSSSPTDNLKNYFLILGEGDIFGINGSFGAPEKCLVLSLVKHIQHFALLCIAEVMIVISLLM